MPTSPPSPTMTPSTMSLMFLFAVLVAPLATAFTTSLMAPAPAMSTTLRLRAPLVGYPMRKTDLSRASSAAANGDNTPAASSKIIQKLEKQEAKINKQRQKAMEKLNQVENSLNQLLTKKQEYLNGDQLATDPSGGVFSETTGRSAVKALLWRLIAGSVTFITSLQFSGSIMTALSIVGSDFFSKAFTMFIGERLMNKSQAGRKSGADGAGRSLVKALIWRVFAIANTLSMAVFISKDLSVASKIASTDAVFKTALMYFYERVWAKIEWGKEYQVEYNL